MSLVFMCKRSTFEFRFLELHVCIFRIYSARIDIVEKVLSMISVTYNYIGHFDAAMKNNVYTLFKNYNMAFALNVL